jgi:putative RNase toxin 46 of polymorphic toxin system
MQTMAYDPFSSPGLAEFGIGVPIALHGADELGTAIGDLINGSAPSSSLTSNALQMYGGFSAQNADLIDAGISLVGTLGGSMIAEGAAAINQINQGAEALSQMLSGDSTAWNALSAESRSLAVASSLEEGEGLAAAENASSRLNILNSDFTPNATSLNKVTAFDLYTASGNDASEALLHMRGIDFTQPVTVETLDPNTVLQQYVKWGRGPGNYFSPPGTNPLEVGIGDAVTRDLIQFENAEPVTALRSTASDFLYPDQVAVPGMGGGTQFYVPNKAAFTPLICFMLRYLLKGRYFVEKGLRWILKTNSIPCPRSGSIWCLTNSIA